MLLLHRSITALSEFGFCKELNDFSHFTDFGIILHEEKCSFIGDLYGIKIFWSLQEVINK